MTQVIFDEMLLKRAPARVARVRRWIMALRSRAYKQGNGSLRQKGRRGTKDRFCCLGVMLDLDQPAGWIDPLEDPEEGTVFHRQAEDEGAEMPGAEACERYGLLHTSSTLSGTGLLAELNDHGRSFAFIASELDRALREVLRKR